MQPVPQPSVEDARANATFAALLSALSRPGEVTQMPDAGDIPIIEALIDRECQVYCRDVALIPVVSATGALIAEIECADHVFLGRMSDLSVLAHVTTGSDLYPDAGATLIIHGELAVGETLTFSGPGVDGTRRGMIGGLPNGFWALRAQLIRYPMGFDMFIVDGSQVLGVPRSCKVEVV